MAALVVPLDTFGEDDVDVVGRKNASLGELLRALESGGVRVPDGAAVTVSRYRAFIEHNGLDRLIVETAESLAEPDDRDLARAGETIRRTVAGSR
jgi:pyruvate,water dikinase